jgi:hypothetical protein
LSSSYSALLMNSIEQVRGEHRGLLVLVQDNAGPRLGGQVAEFPDHRGLWIVTLGLPQIEPRIAALPGVDKPERRPVVLWQDLLVGAHHRHEGVGSFGIGGEPSFDGRADGSGDPQVSSERSLSNVVLNFLQMRRAEAV